MLGQIVMNAKERKIIIQGNKIALGVSETSSYYEKVIFE